MERVIELLDSSSPDDSEETVRPGPLWRHAVWVVGITVLGVAVGWAGALFRIGPEEYGLPSAAPGPVRPYLVAWITTGLMAAAALRAAAAKVPLYAPGRTAAVLTALATAVLWCAFALRPSFRRNRGGGL